MCEKLHENESTASHMEDLYWSYVANCVLNAFLSYTAIMLNILTIHAMRKTPSLPKPLKTLLLSLAVSDLGVGLLVQPFYSVLLDNLSQQNDTNCSTQTAFRIAISVFFFPSFFGVMALIADRFLSVHLHLRYQELVTHKRVVAVVISIWLFSPLLSFLVFTSWIPRSIIRVFLACGVLLCAGTTAILNLKIYLTIRRHTNQIQALQILEQNGGAANFSRTRKSALGTFYVYIVFLICCLPQSFYFFFMLLYGSTNTLKAFSLYSHTLMFLNSSLNPVIYCWKMRDIRHAIVDVLRNIYPR